MKRKERIRILEKEFCFKLTENEKDFILDEQNSEIRVENFQSGLFEKYLNPPKPQKKQEKMVFYFGNNAATTKSLFD